VCVHAHACCQFGHLDTRERAPGIFIVCFCVRLCKQAQARICLGVYSGLKTVGKKSVHAPILGGCTLHRLHREARKLVSVQVVPQEMRGCMGSRWSTTLWLRMLA